MLDSETESDEHMNSLSSDEGGEPDAEKSERNSQVCTALLKRTSHKSCQGSPGASLITAVGEREKGVITPTK